MLYLVCVYSKIQVNKKCCNQMSYIVLNGWRMINNIFVVVLEKFSDQSLLSLCLSPAQHWNIISTLSLCTNGEKKTFMFATLMGYWTILSGTHKKKIYGIENFHCVAVVFTPCDILCRKNVQRVHSFCITWYFCPLHL